MKAYVLRVKFKMGGREDVIYPVILKNSQDTILVDCGYAGFMPLIQKEAQIHGISLQDLTGIIVTHHDIDHVGGLSEIKEKYPWIKVYSSKEEESYIAGREKSLRLIQAENLYDSLYPEQKPGALSFQEMLRSVQPVAVDYTFADDEDALFSNEVKIINTPGHMPGHISVYLKGSKTLIAADAIVCEEGELQIANVDFTLDLPQAIASIKKLRELEISRLICYHGGVVEDNVQQRLSSLLSHYC